MTAAEAEQVLMQALVFPYHPDLLADTVFAAFDFLRGELARKDKALRTIAEHEMVLEVDPCDWHCTKQLTMIARAALREREWVENEPGGTIAEGEEENNPTVDAWNDAMEAQ